MNKRAIRAGAVSAVGAAAIVGAGIVAVSASGTPAAAPDANRVGAITLKVNNNAVTSGSLTDTLTAVGDANSALSGSKAVLYAYVHGSYAYGGPSTSADLTTYQPSLEGTWTGAQLAPAVDSTGLSVPLGSSTTLGQFLNAYTPDASGLVELRLETISPGQSVSSAYDAIDLYVDAAHRTWSTTESVATSPGGGATTPGGGKTTPGGGKTTSGGSGTKPSGGKTTPAAKKTATVTETIARKVKRTKKVPITITVKASGTVPTGTVTVYDGTKKLKSAALSGGRASLKLKKLKRGKHKIRTVYSGSTAVAAATSTTITVKSK